MTRLEVTALFGVGHYATVSVTVRGLERWMGQDRDLRRRIESVRLEL